MDEAVSRCRDDLRGGFSTAIRAACGNLHRCDSWGAQRYVAPPRRQATPLIGRGPARREVAGEGFLELDAPRAERVHEREPPLRAGTAGRGRAGERRLRLLRRPDPRRSDARSTRGARGSVGATRPRRASRSVVAARRSRTSNRVSARRPSVASTTTWPPVAPAARRPRTRRAPRSPAPGRGTGGRPRAGGTAHGGSRRPRPSSRPRAGPRSPRRGDGRSPVAAARPPARAGPHPEQPVHERPAAPADRGVRHEARGLRDHDEMLVLVADRDRRPSAGSGPSARASTSSRSPPSSRNDFGRGSPSTRTRPAAIARCTSALGRPDRRATTASSRPSSASNVGVTRTRGWWTRRLVPFSEPDHREEDRADDDRRVGQVEHGPDVQVDEVDHAPPERGGPEGPVREVPERSPRTRPSEAATNRFVCRNDVARIATTTTAVTATKNHGALRPMLNAPPLFVVKRSVSTPGISSIGSPGSVASAQIFVIRSTP